ncbi:hypothetical protein DID75_02190 [Candidatus Marinamargulisbacteria bacterium SCGC AG-410-N11]|nr:hypothetical protein DID75_02190 [Candidatus Marinamargulisbacteria bacterium SCGC AG-410-N11]
MISKYKHISFKITKRFKNKSLEQFLKEVPIEVELKIRRYVGCLYLYNQNLIHWYVLNKNLKYLIIELNYLKKTNLEKHINLVDMFGMTPLMYTLKTKQSKMLKLLIDNGANLNHKKAISNQLTRYLYEYSLVTGDLVSLNRWFKQSKSINKWKIYKECNKELARICKKRLHLSRIQRRPIFIDDQKFEINRDILKIIKKRLQIVDLIIFKIKYNIFCW